MNDVITFFIGFIFGYIIASVLLADRKFIVKTNEKGETTIEPQNRPKQKMEFAPDLTQKEIEDEERPTGLKGFLGKFAKPAKKEDEEETEF